MGEQRENRMIAPESRLGSYLFVIGTIVVTVLFITVHSVKFMETSFGGLDSKSVSTIELRPLVVTNYTQEQNSNLRGSDQDDNEKVVSEEFISNDKEEELDQDKDQQHENDNTASNTESTEEITYNEPLVIPKMLDSVLEAHQAMIDKLRRDYGDEYFDKIFRRSGEESEEDKLTPEKLHMEYLPIRPFGPKDLYFTNHFKKEQKEAYDKNTQPQFYHSIFNFRRKLMIKILRANDNDENHDNKYVWATGGHSAAAGHGNLFNETYTKVMEKTCSQVFQNAGLQLEARNYAMGATSSAAEMSMCFSQIYGDDVDVFGWDFAMLEARDYLSGRLLHYATRGFLSNQHGVVPAFVGLQEVGNSRKLMMEELHHAFKETPEQETNGLALFLRDDDYWKLMKKEIPDNAGLTTDEINELPEFVRHFKCDGAIEKGSPFCSENKYSEEVCPNRMGKASWHPGWKYNAMLGNAMALFLTEMLVGAVREIEETLFAEDSEVTPDEFLAKLLQEEDAHRERLFGAQASQLPPSYQKVYWYNNTSDDWKNYNKEETLGLETGSEDFQAKWSALDREALFHGPSMCHTARVPSQTRFFGHLTNQPELKGEQVVFGKETYFTGIEEKEYHEHNKNLNTEDLVSPRDMQLVWVKNKEREESCGDVLAKPDYHDYFMTEEYEGWTTVEFPNQAEQEAYGYLKNKEKFKGILIIVPRFCGFGKCEKGFLGVDEYNEGKWAMTVNGKSVTAMTKIGHEAILLENEDGLRFDPNNQGIYRLEFRVNEPESFIKISAFVLY
eukprot:CAMPEP_0116130070 /NCGR_PEP_ID=MMETSP0329-20121206/8260_1 /TAXON_ID=697910 /ORGANISM="Pseudo-nitzschia arenysensis, Strain B593" /LENGTH=783 /DNA_ID=CAMNT_0003624377 /DNA_START=18 /DNA_END=2369 /DNA_ORIENTATION=+